MPRKQDVEYPTLEGKGHSNDCRVWNGLDWHDACNCGVDSSAVLTRTFKGFSNYEIREDQEVRSLRTGKLLSKSDRNTVVLVGDDGSRGTYNVVDLVRWAFMESE